MKHIQMSLPQICSVQFCRDCYFTMETKPALTQKTVLTSRNDQTLYGGIQEGKKGRINITHTHTLESWTPVMFHEMVTFLCQSIHRWLIKSLYNHPPVHKGLCVMKSGTA